MPADTAPPAHDEVVRAVHAYAAALYDGDVEGLRRAFHPRAHYATPSGGELLQLDVDAYMDVVAARASPRERGDRPDVEIDTLLFAGDDCVTARLRSTMLGRDFVDLVTFVRLEGRWQIVSKVFHFDE